MARTNSHTRRTEDESPDSSVEPPRGVRIDPAHTAPLDPRIAAQAGTTDDSVTLSGGPHVEWEPDSLQAADAALNAVWDELDTSASQAVPQSSSPTLNEHAEELSVEALSAEERAALPTMRISASNCNSWRNC
ncbi:MAG: hypothetical protein QM811_18705 [Pirellulales bacterium]